LRIERRGGPSRRELRAIANNDNMRGIDALSEDAIAHVVAEHDNPGGAAQCPAMQVFPKARQQAGGNDGTSQGHIGIQVSDVVDVRLAFQEGDKGADDTLEGRVGHGQNDVTRKREGPRNSQENIAQVIEHASFHLPAGKIRGAGADDPHAPAILGLVEAPGPAFGGIVGRASAENRDVMLFGKGIGKGLRHFRGCRSVRRIVEVQEQNAHGEIVLVPFQLVPANPFENTLSVFASNAWAIIWPK